MIEFIEKEFTFNVPDKDGSTLLSHLLAAEEARPPSAPSIPQLEEYRSVEPPEELFHLYTYWQELHQARGNNGYGPNKLSYQDILSWKQLHDADVGYFSINTILEIENRWLSEYHKKNTKK